MSVERSYIADLYDQSGESPVCLGPATIKLVVRPDATEVEVIEKQTLQTYKKFPVSAQLEVTQRPGRDAGTTNVGLSSQGTARDHWAFALKFDKNSSAAAQDFFSQLQKAKQQPARQCLYYRSGRLQYDGDLVDGVANGQGELYADVSGNPLIYRGEFENGALDGAGSFFSADGTLQMRCNNISRGRPNGRCIIAVSDRRGAILSKVEFDAKDVLQLTPGVDRTYVVPANYCEQVAKIVGLNHTDALCRHSTLEEKIDLLLRRLESVSIGART